MRNTTLLLGTVAFALLIGISAVATATQRAALLQLSWGRTVPEAGKPLLVYVTTGEESRDQDRYDDVVLANESLLLAAKFYTCVEMSDDDARKLPLFAEIKLKAPAMVAFDATRKEHAVAGGRASAMKVYGMLCKVGQTDYETSIASTVRAARNLLGSFDRIDAAQDALGIKQARLDEARGDADSAKIRKLERDVDKDQAAIDELSEKTQTRWSEIWDLKRKKRESADEERAEEDAAEKESAD
jgi:hypothetical protein